MPGTVKSIVCVLAVLALAACGGGSSSSAVSDSQDPPATGSPTADSPTAGRVTVLLTDGPGRDWDQAFATITSIELLGNGRDVSLFEGNSTVDLLSLPDYYEVFSVADGVLPGTFKSLRLMVDTLELVDLDDQGNEVSRIQAQLVGGGKIDLNPRKDIVVGPGDSLFVAIDFDMNKAFKTTSTGNGRVIVRPVIMVNITSEPPVGKLTRLRGTIEEIDAEGLAFELCQDQLVNAVDDSDDEDYGFSDHAPCLGVTVDGDTGLFGAEGLPIEFADLTLGDQATVVGHLRREQADDEDGIDSDDDEDAEDDNRDRHGDRGHDKGGSHDDNDVVLLAATVELGDAFRRVSGVADGAVAGDVFDLAIDPGQNLGTNDEILSTRLFAGTRIFDQNGEELDQSAILAGVGVLADGVLIPDETMPDTLRAALLILNPDLGPSEEVLRGEIVSVNFDAGTLELMVGDVEQCVNALDADIFLVSNVDGLSSEKVGLGDLEPLQSADVFGTGQDDAGCFLATDILAAAIPENSLPVANAGEDQSVETGTGVTLNGSESTDEDGDVLTYAWMFVSIPENSTAVLMDADTAMPTFIADLDGEYVVELVVNDGMEDSAPDEVVITASAGSP